jgi:hypothetical protein
MKNSHSAWRLYRQSAKHIVELATRAQDPEVAELLVELLNEHLDKCKALLNTEVGQQMARYIAGKDCIQQQESDVPAALDEAYATEPSKRTPKPINRFNPYHYDTKGREIDLTKPTLARNAMRLTKTTRQQLRQRTSAAHMRMTGRPLSQTSIRLQEPTNSSLTHFASSRENSL